MELDPLPAMAAGGKRAVGKRLFETPASAERGGHMPIASNGAVARPLKDFSSARITGVELVEGQRTRDIRGPKSGGLLDIRPRGTAPSISKDPAVRRAYTDREREDIGFELLAKALKKLDGSNLEDFRDIHRLGTDSIDDLRRAFEMKVFAGQMDDVVRLEPTQFERAIRDGSAFFLAVVSGLEVGETKIRIIARPLVELELRRVPRLMLGGIRSAKALDLTIATDEDDPVGD
jgi:hypothetical protein